MITEEMLKRAAQVFCDEGFEISLPSEGDLDDVERERYETLKAALNAALSDQVVGWQPIETAPKRDGVFVDLWFPQRIAGEYGRVPDCQWIEKTTTPGWYAANDENDSMYYVGDRATHWRYRPESPPQPSEDNGPDTNGGER